jgi:hypothetical protein
MQDEESLGRRADRRLEVGGGEIEIHTTGDVAEDRLCSRDRDRVGRRDKVQRRQNDLVPRSATEREYGEVEGRGAV